MFIVDAQQVVNGSLQKWDSRRKSPAGWKNQTSAISSVEPESKGGVRIKVTAAYRFHTALTQRLSIKSKEKWLKFTGHISSNIPNMAYLEVRLFKKNRQIGRLASIINPGRPAVASVNFNTANADRVDLVCRVAADKKNIGKSAVFSNLKLIAGKDPDAAVPFKIGKVNPKDFINCSGTTTVEATANAVTIQVENPGRFDSALRLKLDKIPSSQTFHFVADAISNRNMNGYISAKLFLKGREIGRKESTSAVKRQKRLFINFNTGNADLIVLLFRVRQNRDDVGTKVRFENLSLGKGKYKNPSASAKNKLAFVSSYQDCSVYVNHCSANDSKTFSSIVKYRRNGSKQWLNASPLVYIPDEKAARSSILKLNENTRYDVQISLNDAGNKEVLNGNFRTQHSQVPIKKNIIIGEHNFRGQLIVKESGTPDGYIRYTAKPDFVLNGINEAEDVIRLENVHHIILDGLTLRGGKRFGITISGSENIIIRNCDIAQFGQTGVPDLSIGYKYCKNNEALRDIAGIKIVDSGKLLIERNFIHDSRGKTCPWFYSHPDGPFGIVLQSTGNITLRYNDIIGSDKFRWNDVIGGYYNDSEFGSFYRDASIYGNFLAFANDDGIELDGGQMNCRFYRNRVEGTLCGVSTAPCLLGPSYIYENLFCNPGDEFQVANVALKNNFGSFGKGKIQYFNNTVYGSWAGYSGYYSIPIKLNFPEELKAYTRNNIFDISGYYYDPGAFVLPNDFDYNLFWNPNKISVDSINSALEQANSRDYESHSLKTAPKFIDAAGGDFRLASDSPAIGAGFPVSGLFDKKPDIGAFQNGGLKQLPYRPSTIATNKSQVNFKWPEAIGDQKIYITVLAKHAGTFLIKQPESNDFFSVYPKKGILEPGKQLELSIKLHSEKMPDAKVYSGAFLICDKNNYTRPVSVRANLRNDTVKVEKIRKKVLYGKVSEQDQNGKCIVEFDIAKTGKYFIFGFMSQAPSDIMMRKIGGLNDFFRIRLYGVVGANRPVWNALSPNLYSRRPYIPIDFKKGLHRFEIMPRKGMPYKIKRIALADSPEKLLYSPFIE